MKIVGITGPSGSGKSMLAGALRARGYLTADADEIYHDLLATSLPMQNELVAAFGTDILCDGQIDRRALAAKVFRTKSRKPLLRLNKITHKYVCRACIAQIRAAKEAGAKGILLDAPLLIEARLDRLCDLVVCVTAPTAARIARISARDGISKEDARARIHAQPDDLFYLKKCDYALTNDGDLAKIDEAAREIDALLSEEHT